MFQTEDELMRWNKKEMIAIAAVGMSTFYNKTFSCD